MLSDRHADLYREVRRKPILTAVGLLVAHLLAFAISSRLVSRGLLDAEARLQFETARDEVVTRLQAPAAVW